MAHTDAQQHGNSTQHPAKPADGAQYPTNNHRKRIIDAADKPVRGLALARLILLVVAGALLAGVVVGFGCILTLRVVDLLQDVIWDRLAEILPHTERFSIAPLLFCTIGGLLVGLATKKAGFRLDTLGTVVQTCRTSGGYRVKNWPWSLVLFALPIMFGGAVGPEAGISGFTASLGTNAMHGMRRSGVAASRNSAHPVAAAVKALSPSRSDEGRRYRKGMSIVLWVIAGGGFVLGALGVASLFGPGAGLPRFDAIPYLRLTPQTWWALLAFPLGLLLALFASASAKLAKWATSRLQTVSKAVVCGVILGLVACFLPLVLFSGQKGSHQLLSSWQTIPVVILMLSCLTKLALTQLCVNTGWVGGEFFPLIFCGVAMGYALSRISGADAMMCVTLVTSTLVAAATQRWFLTTCVLALCFPLADLPIVALVSWASATAMRALTGLTNKRRKAKTPESITSAQEAGGPGPGGQANIA